MSRGNAAERKGEVNPDEVQSFEAYTGFDIAGVSRGEIRALLQESGLWTAFRTRPFGRVPHADSEPDCIFITAMDSNPLAPDPDVVLDGTDDPRLARLLREAVDRLERAVRCRTYAAAYAPEISPPAGESSAEGGEGGAALDSDPAR